MQTPDLFPVELDAAQRELAASAPYEPELDDATFDDDKRETELRGGYWLTWAHQYADDVGVRCEGPI
jgi:hypothetical protein